MSAISTTIDTYDRDIALLEIKDKLNEAEEQLKLDLPTKSHKEIISSLRGRINAKL